MNYIFDTIALAAILAGGVFLYHTSRSLLGRHLNKKAFPVIPLFLLGFSSLALSLLVSIFMHHLEALHHSLLALAAIFFMLGFKKLLEFINPKM